MKKMSKSSGNILITEAASTFNGISFRIVKMIDDLIGIERGEYFTQKDENGTIVTHEGTKEAEYLESKFKLSTKTKIITLIALYILMMATAIFFSTSRTIEILTGAYLIGMGLIFMTDQIEVFILATFGNEKYKRFRRYHAAEHAVVNAFYDLHRIPTMNEIKKVQKA